MIDSCKIIDQIATGGQKTVFLAEHPSNGLVVIKKGTTNTTSSLSRIDREFNFLSEITSEYYPRQFYFNKEDKYFEIIEEYIEGKTLRDTMNSFTKPKEIFNLLFHLAKGLSILWEKKIVHRDLKPENIIIRDNGLPCIIDLGIARFTEMDSLTKTSLFIGPCTPIYASPEQLSNSKELIDIRTDFFNLGIIALELYLSQHPFHPSIVENDLSIVENIIANKYKTSSMFIPEHQAISDFAKKTLTQHPYQRFRTIQILIDFISKQL